MFVTRRKLEPNTVEVTLSDDTLGVEDCVHAKTEAANRYPGGDTGKPSVNDAQKVIISEGRCEDRDTIPAEFVNEGKTIC